jgi:Zn-dependent protease with chaperone function
VIVTFAIASIGTRRANGRTFWAQAAANRRNSILMVITLVGIVAATAEAITASLTFRATTALTVAVIAAIAGVGAAAVGNRFGSRIILETAGARPADPSRDGVLIDVVRELALAANVPTPEVYVIDDRSQNAFATGRDPGHAAVAVTSGLLQAMDREQLQGVIGHELGHVAHRDSARREIECRRRARRTVRGLPLRAGVRRFLVANGEPALGRSRPHRRGAEPAEFDPRMGS